MFSPLTGNLVSNGSSETWYDETADYYGEDAYEGEPLCGQELISYLSEIETAVKKENAHDSWDGNIIAYFPEADARGTQVLDKVIRAEIGVDVHEGALCGCTTVTLREPLTSEELGILQDYLSGQYSDGWGEGFEQREIRVDGGELYVHFWQPIGFAFETAYTDKAVPQQGPSISATVPRRPKMRLVGMDGNIFAIMGRASNLLRQAGLGDQVKEMTDRVQNSGNYYRALGIISEYVETEMSPLPKPPRHNRGNAR